MRVLVGPVAPNSARAWTGWAQEVLGELRAEPAPSALPPQVLDHVDSYVGSWAGATANGDEAFRWHADVHPDDLEYLTNALYNLDRHLANAGCRCSLRAQPAEGHAFHLVLVRALLLALSQEGAGRAAFASQLRPSWPVAVEGE